ncbi:unnamed protein product, partial [Symbiodinium microadriaticum]
MERSTLLAQDGSQFQLLHVGERNMAGESILDTGSLALNTTAMPGGNPSRSKSQENGRHRERRSDKRRNNDGSVKLVKVRSELRVKKDRVQTLRNEIDELKAMQAHVEDQSTAVVYDHNELGAKLNHLERKHHEAVALDKLAAAQHLSVE